MNRNAPLSGRAFRRGFPRGLVSATRTYTLDAWADVLTTSESGEAQIGAGLQPPAVIILMLAKKITVWSDLVCLANLQNQWPH